MARSEINTFMSHGAVNGDADSSERERGAWSVVAWNQRDGSGNHIGARARPLAATSVPLCGARTCDSACATGWRTVSTGDIQDTPRRACTIARLFSQQRFVTKRNCHSRSDEVLDIDAATPFDRLLPIKLQQVYGLLVMRIPDKLQEALQIAQPLSVETALWLSVLLWRMDHTGARLMSHANQLIEIATELAMDAKDNVADLQRKLSAVEAAKLEIEGRLDTANHALKPLSSFVSTRGSYLQCPRCG